MLGPEYLASHSAQILETTKRHLRELYQCLVAPFAASIRTRHVTIVPHGTLHFLPFHAFYDGAKYLIDHFEISYAPSASVLKYCLEKGEVPEKTPVLVGVADENAPLVANEIATLRRLFPYVLETNRIAFLRAFGIWRRFFVGLDLEENLDGAELRMLAQIGGVR